MEARYLVWLFVLVILATQAFLSSSSDSGLYSSEITLPMPEPGPLGPKHDEYRCTSISLPQVDSYIVQYEPRADPRVAHHMLVFGCSNTAPSGSWDCVGMSSVCGSRNSPPKVIYAWALNATGLQLPSDVGIKIGPSAQISSIAVQIHYGHPETVPDLEATSKDAVRLITTQQVQRYVAGIYLLGSGRGVRGGTDHAYVDTACKFTGPNRIYTFAFRTHAHSLGEQIAGYVIKSDKWELIGTRSPQDAQAFYPAASIVEVNPGDWLAARCVYNMKGHSQGIHMGPSSDDEMCNFYIMYYTLNTDHSLELDECWSPAPKSFQYPTLPKLPPSSQTTPTHDHGHTHMHEEHGKPEENEEDEYLCPQSVPPGLPNKCLKQVPDSTTNEASESTTTPEHPSTITVEEGEVSNFAELGLVPAEDWELNGVDIPGMALGQVSAVAVDKDGAVHILHRGPVTWDGDSFNKDFTYRHQDSGPIKVPTILKFSTTGTPQHAWGESQFYIPHGLTIDSHGHFWVTDVALHQVFKYLELSDTEPSMILGTKFKPGTSFGHFCQPASVAVEESGTFYVADGYCNQRILQFDHTGLLLSIWEDPIAGVSVFVPHKLSLNAEQNRLFVADRENGRVVTYDTSTGVGSVFSDSDILDGKPYAVYVNGSFDWPVYGVFGKSLFRENEEVYGFTLDKDGNKLCVWGPEEGFQQPHDLTVDPVHQAVYITEIGPNRIWKLVTVNSNPTNVLNDLDSLLPSTPSTHSHKTPPKPTHSPPLQPSLPNIPITAHQQPATPADTATHPQPMTSGIGFLPDEPIRGPSPSSPSDHLGDEDNTLVSLSTTSSLNNSVFIESDDKSTSSLKQSTYNFGIFVAIFLVAVVILLVLLGVLKESKYLKYRCWLSRPTKKTLKQRKNLKTLLGPSQLGFSRLRTYDSDSEAEEFPVFNRV